VATATVVDPRVDGLCQIYQPKKVTQAAITIVDTPGLSRSHEGSAAKLALIREAGALVIVVAGFSGANAVADLASFEEDLLIADLDIVTGRVEKLREGLKKRRGDREQEVKELEALESVLQQLDAGKLIRDLQLTPEQSRAIKSFQLLTGKPRLVMVNVADDEPQPERHLAGLPNDTHALAFSISLQLELQQMPQNERRSFCQEMGIVEFDRDKMLHKIMDISGQMLFFTAGEKEVRTWILRKGSTAADAAASIHTDLARGFVRAETMNCDDLIRLGSEREIKAQNLLRKEHRDYIVNEGDILYILAN
jgi:ribosome-binding ATPase YchF (GTP1/OBG family)